MIRKEFHDQFLGGLQFSHQSHNIKPTMNKKPLRILSRAVFSLGVVIGLALAIITIWNRLESTNYYFEGVKFDPFNGLRCPVMIAPTEKGIVTAVFNNRTDKEDNFFYRAEISGTPSTRQVEDQITVPSHQRRSIQLTVDANDVDLLFFILVKMTILPNSVHPSQEAVCGIMVVNVLGLTGTQLSTTAIVLSFLGIAIGLGLWQQAGTKANGNAQHVIQTLGFVVLLAMFAGAMGWWIAGIALSVITLLLLVISLRFAIA